MFSTQKKRETVFNLRKPWFTKGLVKSVKKKNRLCKCFLNNSKSSNVYKSYKNKLTHSLRVAKCLYYENQIEKLKLNVKAISRKVLNEILNRKKSKRSFPSVFRADSNEISAPKEKANPFCKYFINIGPNLA